MASSKYNLAVLGAGSGGLVSAAGASGLGAKVVLIEKHKMGGDCLNTGCVPSKALIKSAKIASLVRKAADYGVTIGDVKVDFRAVMERVQSIIRRIEPHDSPERFRGLGVDVRFGAARFLSAHEVTDGKETFFAKKIVIATGSRPLVPPIKGLEAVTPLTSENVWETRELPKRLVVVGGGPIGCELAQCFRRFGSEVTIVVKGDRLLPRDDRDASLLLMEVFRREGIRLLLDADAKEVAKRGNEASLVADVRGERVEVPFDAILLAAGRLPNVEGLDLEKAGVEYGPRGIKVNESLQTSRSHIYACGDVAGPYLFTHTADYQARLILRNAFFPGQGRVDYTAIPWCTYTDPEVAHAGLTLEEAEKRGIAVDVTRYSLEGLDRAICDDAAEGFVKALTKRGTDKLVGVTIVAEHAGDLLHELVLAMRHGVGLKKISATIHAYPTWAEAPKRTADQWMRGKLTPGAKAMLTRYFAFLRG